MGHFHPVVRNHFRADENQNRAQAIVQVAKQVHHAGQQEVQRPQAQDGEDIRGEYDERILRDAEDGRHAVDGEQHVGAFDHQQHEKQRRDAPAPTLADEKSFAVRPFGHAEVTPSKPQQEILIGMVTRSSRASASLIAGVNQEAPKIVTSPTQTA